MKIKYFLTIIISFLSLLSLTVFAKETSLYDQPKSDAKVIGAIDLAMGIIPIFTPKGSEWIKIADPRNGNVGWIKSSELHNPGRSQTIFTYTESGNDKTPTTYKIIQFGQSTNISAEQSQALAKKIQTQEQEFQKSMQDMMNTMNRLFSNDLNLIHERNSSFIMPMVILPVEKAQTTKK